MKIIDAHQHFWYYNKKTHAWIDDEMAVIRRDFLPKDLIPVFYNNNIEGCVAVQADQTEAETQFLCDLAIDHDFIKGVVGWVDLKSVEIENLLEKWSAYEVIKGFRHIVQGEADHNFVLRPPFMNGMKALTKYDFTYDILIFPHQLLAAYELVIKFPNQKFIIDHIAKPYIKDGYYDGWAVMMRQISSIPNVYCKLSGMVTEACYQSWTAEQINPYIDHVLECFGPDRIVYGSDWPVCLVAGSYKEVLDLVRNRIARLSQDEQERIMALNVIDFYNLTI